MSGNTHAAAPSRDLIVAELVARTGIDEPMIDRLVRAFYGRARLDPLLGPVFKHDRRSAYRTRRYGGMAEWRNGRTMNPWNLARPPARCPKRTTPIWAMPQPKNWSTSSTKCLKRSVPGRR